MEVNKILINLKDPITINSGDLDESIILNQIKSVLKTIDKTNIRIGNYENNQFEGDKMIGRMVMITLSNAIEIKDESNRKEIDKHSFKKVLEVLDSVSANEVSEVFAGEIGNYQFIEITV